jgi:hypothetical protein
VAVTIKEQRYGPTTGTVTGWIGLTMCTTAVVLTLLDPTTVRIRYALVYALLGVVVWAYILRPRVIIREPTALLLRNAFSTWEVPLAAVTSVGVKAIIRVRTGERAYDGIGVGRRVMKMVRGPQGHLHGPTIKHPRVDSPEAVADLVVEQVLAASERARESGQPTNPALRRWAWLELVFCAALLVGFVGTYL